MEREKIDREREKIERETILANMSKFQSKNLAILLQWIPPLADFKTISIRPALLCKAKTGSSVAFRRAILL